MPWMVKLFTHSANWPTSGVPALATLPPVPPPGTTTHRPFRRPYVWPSCGASGNAPPRASNVPLVNDMLWPITVGIQTSGPV